MVLIMQPLNITIRGAKSGFQLDVERIVINFKI